MNYIRSNVVLVVVFMFHVHGVSWAAWCPPSASPPCPPAGAPGSGHPPDCATRAGCISSKYEIGSGNCDPLIMITATGQTGFISCIIPIDEPPYFKAGHAVYPLMDVAKRNQSYKYGHCSYDDDATNCKTCTDKNSTSYTEKLIDAQSTYLGQCLEYIVGIPCEEGALA